LQDLKAEAAVEFLFDNNPMMEESPVHSTNITRRALGAKPTAINGEVGGTFTLFGGYVTGRNLEMLPAERLVQAWRAGSWKPGAFSIAAFSFVKAGTKTKLLFDHRGFPDGQGASLAQGWHAHYWGPLTTFFSQG
jgi:activator of HSP90 ATPase